MCCELPQCITEAKPVARKQHRCCECQRAIEKGEQYSRVSGIWDCQPARFKTCLDCKALRTEADENVQYNDERTPFGYLHETLKEMHNEELSKRFAEIKAKRREVGA
jgi:hypothetical protein